MHTRTPESLAAPHVGGKLATIIFVFTLLGFVIETQLTQYVQTSLGYRQSFFLFYIVHSSFAIIFPLHLLYLIATTNHSAVSLLKGLAIAISNHLVTSQKSNDAFKFPTAKFFRLSLALMVGVTCPGLLWFAAIPLASITDVTAIWNTNAFFAYLISVKVFKLKWEPKRLMAVVLATIGTAVVVYGGSKTSEESGVSTTPPSTYKKPAAPLIGNLMTLIASFGYGLYQVLYKVYAALPSDPEVTAERAYEQIPDEEGGDVSVSVEVDATDAVYPPPFGFHPNFLTSILGILTCLILWIPLPFLHYSRAEVFRLPPNLYTALCIAGISLSGVAFNAGFMVLLGVWGPIIVSVGNLLTIVLVLISDVLFGPGLQVITLWSLIGSAGIVLAFGILAYDMFSKRS
ncbi:hypothetical protein NLJ89_g6610 [Agrocybe chaxingu]|uniref:EamA domain-containing protein n=1 Tax=Agrocybe chaxingu TaxID=84603 RepID=A0A9W8MVU9_9AGAR|nr:hypothetical protein NLJ89_g6610 [Agrocybe chaxingu]